jgi:septum formation protein
MVGHPPLVLASASPRRRALLKEKGFRFTVEPANVPEISPPYFSPGETVLFNARAKCRAVALKRYEQIVLGVDTEVALGTEVLGKPADMEAAFAMLSRLNGRSHHVYSGLWLARLETGEERGAVEVTTVYFKRLTASQLRTYLERIGPLDKAGAYAAQEDHGEIIDHVEGSFSNVIGLPLETLDRELKRFSSPVASSR